MDTDTLARGNGPEPTLYDKRRHEEMRIKGMAYGVPKFFLDSSKIQKGCDKCGYIICRCEK